MNERNKENLKQNAKEKDVGDFPQISHCRSVKISKNFEMTLLHLSIVKACIMFTAFTDFIKYELNLSLLHLAWKFHIYMGFPILYPYKL